MDPALSVKFQPILAHAKGFPDSRVPLLQPPSLANWFGADRAVPSAFLGAGNQFFSASRYALLEAFRRCGVGPGDKVLVPAFHCRTMVDPLVHLRAHIVFYHVTPNLWLEESSLKQRCAGARAMLLTHYFGFPNNVAFAAEFCARRNIALVEDCAHALYGEHDGVALGTTGLYAAASVWKFLPAEDGAVLRDNTGVTVGPLRAPTFAEEAAGVVRFVQQLASHTFRRRQAVERATAATHISAARALPGGSSRVETKDSVDRRNIGVRGLKVSRWILDSARHSRIVKQRRENYARWAQAIAGVPGIVPLYTKLPLSVVPYAFPVLLTEAEPAFSALKLAGVPIGRWEDMAVTDCPVAHRYRERLFQLPLHQELSNVEMDWMIKTVTDVFRELA